MTACKYGDEFCPCQDGDLCHYEGKNAMKPTDKLHAAVCQAVALLNRAPEVATCAEGREAHDILRQALVNYADSEPQRYPGGRITYRGYGYGMGSQDGIDSLRAAINERKDY